MKYLLLISLFSFINYNSRSTREYIYYETRDDGFQLALIRFMLTDDEKFKVNNRFELVIDNLWDCEPPDDDDFLRGVLFYTAKDSAVLFFDNENLSEYGMRQFNQDGMPIRIDNCNLQLSRYTLKSTTCNK